MFFVARPLMHELHEKTQPIDRGAMHNETHRQFSNAMQARIRCTIFIRLAQNHKNRIKGLMQQSLNFKKNVSHPFYCVEETTGKSF